MSSKQTYPKKKKKKKKPYQSNLIFSSRPRTLDQKKKKVSSHAQSMRDEASDQ